MPRRPKTPCPTPGCPELVHGRYCEKHQRARQAQCDKDRPNSTARGYGGRWRLLRVMYLRAHPFCMANACQEQANHVDHIIPKSAGGSDAWDNLQGLCHSCHSKKTLRERRPMAVSV